MTPVNIEGRDKQKLDLATIIAVLGKEMKLDRAYYIKGLLKLVNKHYPSCSQAALRRYLTQMENLGLLVGKKDGRFKVYASSQALI